MKTMFKLKDNNEKTFETILQRPGERECHETHATFTPVPEYVKSIAENALKVTQEQK